MSDWMSGIKQITPSYPVKPVQPSNKDREPGEERKKKRELPEKERPDDDRPTIDDHV